jgi:hypothetical protein
MPHTINVQGMERPLFGAAFLRFLRRNEMSQEPRKADSELLRERALWCRQLADGVGDAGFAKKLYELSDEYEGRKKRPCNNYLERSAREPG